MSRGSETTDLWLGVGFLAGTPLLTFLVGTFIAGLIETPLGRPVASLFALACPILSYLAALWYRYRRRSTVRSTFREEFALSIILAPALFFVFLFLAVAIGGGV